MKRVSGFTVVELMVVIGIIGIVSAIAVPGFVSWVPGYRLKSAAMDLYSNIQLARMYAIKDNRPYSVEFNTAANSYKLVDNGYDGEFDTIDDEVKMTVLLSDYQSGVTYGHGDATHNANASPTSNFPDDGVSYTPNRVQLDSRGKSEGYLGWVYLQAQDGKSYVVGTPYMTGLVVIKRWNGNRYE